MQNDFVGKKFNGLTIISIERGTKDNNYQYVAECICDCGKTKITQLRNIRNSSCKSCGSKECVKRYQVPYNLTTFVSKYIILSLWNKLKIIAIQNNKKKEFSITPDYLDSLWEECHGRCYLSGLTLTLPSTATEFQQHLYTASLDRIDSSIGYIEGNVNWSHKEVNVMKLHLSNDEFIILCKEVSNASKN